MTDSTRVFIQLNAYADVAAAEADQQTVKDLHSSDQSGRFETTVIARDDQGQVRVVKGEATARRWASRGLVVVGEESVRHAIEFARLTPLRTSIKTGHGTYSDLEGEVMTALSTRVEDTPST